MFRILTILPFVLILFAVACNVDKDSQITANNALIDKLPIFPHAREISRGSSGYEFEEDLFGGTDGYTTTATFLVPSGTKASAVAEFYARISLPSGWQRILGAHLFICADQGELRVVVTSVEETGLPVYTISADNKGLPGGCP